MQSQPRELSSTEGLGDVPLHKVVMCTLLDLCPVEKCQPMGCLVADLSSFGRSGHHVRVGDLLNAQILLGFIIG